MLTGNEDAENVKEGTGIDVRRGTPYIIGKCLPADGEHIFHVGDHGDKARSRRRGRTGSDGHFRPRGQPCPHGQDSTHHQGCTEVRDSPRGSGKTASLDDLVEHHREYKTTARATGDDDTHGKRPASPEMMSDNPNGGEEEKAQSDTRAYPLSEEYLIELSFVSEGEHIVRDDVKDRCANHHGVEEAGIEKLAGNDTHGELEEELD
jgi:hypothetical protein